MRRVLILEQEAFLGTLLSERFRRSGFSVQLLSGVPRGVSAVTDPPDLIVVGGAEPGALESLGAWAAAVPTIVLGEPEAGSPAWPFPTLDKPFSPNQLVDLAGRYLLAQKLQGRDLDDTSPHYELGTIPIS